MIFKRISILNLFSYYGEQEFLFSNPAPDKPIVLIFGKNGFGKTNFINCVKLLFLGTSTPMLEDVAGKRRFTSKSYLLGGDNEWQGVFNVRAREDIRNNGTGKFGITLEWQETVGRVIARRFWLVTRDEISSRLEIDIDFEENGYGNGQTILDQDEAEKFLQQRVPRNIVSLFFHDGEKVQHLAERQQQGLLRHIENLLDLTAIDTLDGSLKRAIAQWRKEGINENESAILDQLLQQAATIEASIAVARAKLDQLDYDIDELERDIKKHERYIANTRTMVAQRDMFKRKDEFDKISTLYATMCQHIAETLPKSAPLWVIPALIDKISHKLKFTLDSKSKKITEEVAQPFSKLPEQLLNEPPHPILHLPPSQKEAYSRKLEPILKTYTEAPACGYFSLNLEQVTELQRRLNYYAQTQHDRTRLILDLHEGTRLRREWQEKKAELAGLEDLPVDRKNNFHHHQEELNKFTQQRDERLIEKGGLLRNIGNLGTELSRKRAEIQKQEANLKESDKNSLNIIHAKAARHVFARYRDKVKATKRAAMEEVLNRHLGKLLTSNLVIDKIEIREDFSLNYLRADGSPVGLLNISAGVKQLIAQALLWALSDISGRKIPIIIDTPLGRIDQKNQENLLHNYYPAAAEQVIILPTDSELDVEKYRMIKPMINTEFHLHVTKDGHTSVQKGACMYDIEGT